MSELTITADCGGSNGTRVRLWKVELQRLADETGLTPHVHHYPTTAETIERDGDDKATAAPNGPPEGR